MFDVLRAQFTPAMSMEEKLNRGREFLQIMALKTIYDKGWFASLAFVGGTALRVLYGLRRFSEDLDFSCIRKEGYDIKKIASQLSHEFLLNGLALDVRLKMDKTVQCMYLKFPRLLYDLGLSVHRDEKFMIKLEVDTNPPIGGKIERTLVNKTYIFSITHFDLASMYAGKLCACFYRKYIKGRDFYDFIWYLTKKTKPNYIVLNNAIMQIQGKSPGLSEQNIKEFLLEKIQIVDFDQVVKDVERFLEDKSELKLFERDLIKHSIEAVF